MSSAATLKISIWHLFVLTALAAVQVRSAVALLFGVVFSLMFLMIGPLVLFLITLFRPSTNPRGQSDSLVEFLLQLMVWSGINLVVVLSIVFFIY